MPSPGIPLGSSVLGMTDGLVVGVFRGDFTNKADLMGFTLWQTNIAIENGHFEWDKSLCLWPCSIAM